VKARFLFILSQNMKKISKKSNKVSRKAKVVKRAYIKNISQETGFLGAEIRKSFNFGSMSARQAKIAVLAVIVVFVSYSALMGKYYYDKLVENIPAPKTLEEARKENLEYKIKELVKGTPIEVMAPYIAEKNNKTAAFLIGIARKESNWGKRRPVLDGKDCFNYWGYRGKSDTMGSGGHTCFDSPEEAVDVVARRIDQIIRRNDVESAKSMIVWKCGSSCAAHNPESVDKWIRDVDMYAGKILN